MKNRLMAVLASIVACQLSLAQFTLTILHTNDLHAHVEPVKIKGIEMGGYARQATLIKKLRAESVNPILLNGGDTFQGTLFFNVYLGLADAAFMSQVGYQAAAVGNHEFDRGPKALADFARMANFPILAANLDVSAEPALANIIKGSTVIQVAGEEIGIVGAVTPDLPTISSPGPNVKMKPLLESVQAEIDTLSAKGINKIIVVSHCGYGVETKLARDLKSVDVVVGGHTHTFLGDTKLPNDLKSAGKYPTVVKNKSSETALVVQSWEWGKVFGKLEVKFDRRGVVESWGQTQPIPVTADIPEDPTVLAMITAFKKPIEDLINKPIGETQSEIPKSSKGQSLMADLITDSMLAATKEHGSVVALMNSGGIRSGLNPGRINYGDCISVQPFNNTLFVLDLTGSELLEALSSGILFISNGSSFEMQQGKAANVVIAGEPLKLDKTYKCTVNSFIADGGDNLQVLKQAKGSRKDTGIVDVDALIQFVQANSPLNLKPGNRIKS